jgi:RNA recognition motif-containing protein
MKIFIAKLHPRTTVDDVRRLFERFGTVSSCKVIMDHETNRSKCYGFVEMPFDNEAYVAVVETNEMEFMGNVINVKKSKPQPIKDKK